MLGETIEQLPKEEVRTHSQTMVDTFLVALDYRTVKRTVGISVSMWVHVVITHQTPRLL